MTNSIRTQSGVTLIEILVTLMILAIGLLGVAGLQVQALRSTKVAFDRSIVLEHARRVIEAVRANPTVATEFAIDSGALPNSAPSCTTACTGRQRAEIDLVTVRNSLEASMGQFDPEFTLDVVPIGAAGDPPFEVQLTINWTTRNDEGSGLQDFSYSIVSSI